MKSIATMLLLLATLLCANVSAVAQRTTPTPKPTQITLVFQPPPGELHEVVTEWVETSNDQQSSLSVDSQLFNLPVDIGQTITARRLFSTWRVLDRDAKGNSVIEITYKYIKSARTIGRMVDALSKFVVTDKGIVIQWDTRRNTAEVNPAFAGIEQLPKNERVEFVIKYLHDLELARQALAKYLIDRPFRIVVDKQARIVEVQDMDLLLDRWRTELAKLTPDFATRAKYDALVTAFLGDDAVRQSLTATQLVPFPASPVSAGEKWSDSFEFTVLGRKVPVTREFSIVESYPDSSQLVGTTKFSLAVGPTPSTTNLVSTNEITTTVYADTGMFQDLKLKGNVMRRSGATANEEFVSSTEATTSISRIATRSESDHSKWRFYGGYEDFYIFLNDHWSREETDLKVLNRSIFVNAQDGSSISSEMLGPGVREGLRLEKKEDIPAYLEEYSKHPQLRVKNSSFKIIKTYRSGKVDWYRAQADVSYEAGFVEHLILQGGFDGTRFYLFVVNAWKTDFERQLAEGALALDSIEVRNY